MTPAQQAQAAEQLAALRARTGQVIEGLEQEGGFVTLFRRDYPERIAEMIKSGRIAPELGTPATPGGLLKALEAHLAVHDYASPFTSFSHTGFAEHIVGQGYRLRVPASLLRDRALAGNEWERELLLMGEQRVRRVGEDLFELLH
jgi:hypothetical protein